MTKKASTIKHVVISTATTRHTPTIGNLELSINEDPQVRFYLGGDSWVEIRYAPFSGIEIRSMNPMSLNPATSNQVFFKERREYEPQKRATRHRRTAAASAKQRARQRARRRTRSAVDGAVGGRDSHRGT